MQNCPDILAEEAAGREMGKRREASDFIGGRRPARCCALDTRLQRSQQRSQQAAQHGARGQRRVFTAAASPSLCFYGRGPRRAMAERRPPSGIPACFSSRRRCSSSPPPRHHLDPPSRHPHRHHLPSTSSTLLLPRHTSAAALQHSTFGTRQKASLSIRLESRSLPSLVSSPRQPLHWAQSAFAFIIHPTKKPATATSDCAAPPHAVICIRSESCSRSE